MAYPKALSPSEFEVGQRIWLLMTRLGKEREKHPATAERPNEFDNWVFEGYVDSIDDEILTVKVAEQTRNIYNLSDDTFRFYINKKYHQVGVAKPDYKLFRNVNEAREYEKRSDYNRSYYENNQEKMLEKTKMWQKEHREEYLNNAKTYRENYKNEIYTPEYHEKKREYFNKQYREKRNEKRRKLRENTEYREKENEQRRKRYTEDPEYRERKKEIQKRYYENNKKKRKNNSNTEGE